MVTYDSPVISKPLNFALAISQLNADIDIDFMWCIILRGSDFRFDPPWSSTDPLEPLESLHKQFEIRQKWWPTVGFHSLRNLLMDIGSFSNYISVCHIDGVMGRLSAIMYVFWKPWNEWELIKSIMKMLDENKDGITISSILWGLPPSTCIVISFLAFEPATEETRSRHLPPNCSSTPSIAMPLNKLSAHRLNFGCTNKYDRTRCH
jgi:hypothetical protein